MRAQIAFYASTPAYRRVLEIHGWGSLHDDLHHLARQDRWAEMGALIDDEVLDAFAIVAPPDEVGPRLAARYADVVDRVNLYSDFTFHDDDWRAFVSGLRA